MLLLKSPLRKRIGIAFFAVIFALITGYSIATALILKSAQSSIFSDMMEDIMQGALTDLKLNNKVVLPPDTYLWGNDPRLERIPQDLDLSNVSEGFIDFHPDKGNSTPALFLYLHKEDGFLYLLGREPKTFNFLENLYIYWIVVIAIILLLSSIVMCQFISSAITQPIKELSEKIAKVSNSDTYTPIKANPDADLELTQLASNFNKTLERLFAALERERNFTGDISHELNNPLSVLETSLEILNSKEKLPHQTKYIEKSMRAARDMSDLISFFLELTRDSVDIGNNPPDSLGRMISRMKDVWEPRAKFKGLDLFIVKKGICPGNYSPILLGTVLSNLIKNAIMYTDAGHVIITETSQGFIVDDTGPGIPEKVRLHLFERISVQKNLLDGVDERNTSHGIGLNLTFRIAKRSGWHIACTLRRGRNNEVIGTRFTVTLNGAKSFKPADVR